MDQSQMLNHMLSRIAPRSDVLDWHTEAISSDNPSCVKMARPLFDAGLVLAVITQRPAFQGQLHTAGHNILTLLLRGSLTVQLGNQEHKMTPGQLAFCPPGSLYNSRADEPTWWLYFVFEDTKHWRGAGQSGAYIRDHESTDLIFVLLQHLIDTKACLSESSSLDNYTKGPSPDSQEEISRSLEHARMLLKILEQEYNLPLEDGDCQVRSLHALVKQIRVAPNHDWTVDVMCDIMHISKRTLSRLVVREYDMSPAQLVIGARMNEAIRQLEVTSNSVMSIAHQVGYSSAYSFSRLFSKHIGMPPGKYRAKLRKNGGEEIL
jgi:AraC-like DNA-binding protein/quercetin dioxygenase-like cupin family protein